MERETTNRELEMTDRKYLISYTYRQWIGKPGAGRLGSARFVCSSLDALAKETQRIENNGHRVNYSGPYTASCA